MALPQRHSSSILRTTHPTVTSRQIFDSHTILRQVTFSPNLGGNLDQTALDFNLIPYYMHVVWRLASIPRHLYSEAWHRRLRRGWKWKIDHVRRRLQDTSCLFLHWIKFAVSYSAPEVPRCILISYPHSFRFLQEQRRPGHISLDGSAPREATR